MEYTKEIREHDHGVLSSREELEKELIEKSNLFGDDISKAEDSGGYIETGIKERGTKSVISKIPTRSGKNFVVKRFDFHVEK